MAFTTTGGPREYLAGPDWTTQTYVQMTAVTATDVSGPVEYLFECEGHSGFNSSWQAAPTYSVNVGRTGQGLKFRVTARDAYGNQTKPSPWTTAIPLPVDSYSGGSTPPITGGGNTGTGVTP